LGLELELATAHVALETFDFAVAPKPGFAGIESATTNRPVSPSCPMLNYRQAAESRGLPRSPS